MNTLQITKLVTRKGLGRWAAISMKRVSPLAVKATPTVKQQVYQDAVTFGFVMAAYIAKSVWKAKSHTPTVSFVEQDKVSVPVVYPTWYTFGWNFMLSHDEKGI